jgi:hypothetical protein
MSYPVDMSDMQRDEVGGSFRDEVNFWEEFELRRMSAFREHLWFAPRPHAYFGYGGFFYTEPVVLAGVRQHQLVARFNMSPMLLFSLPQRPWAGDHDAHVPLSAAFNPIWMANERTRGGAYQLHLFMFEGVRYIMTVAPILRGETVHLHYGRIDNRTWISRPRSVRQTRRALYMMRRVPYSWPAAEELVRNNQIIERGFNLHFVDLVDDREVIDLVSDSEDEDAGV